ncbi:zinc transporter ZIP1-like [Oscarella lobularis]|uniref:zinc transporter ZIP1-like n=1 Tax=Oscarella lobularis TaxID=121494 RepID=UPI0033139134
MLGRQVSSFRSVLDHWLLLFTGIGGVFLGTGLLHLIPESSEKFESYNNKNGSTHVDYPVTELCIGLGFIFVFLLEQGIALCQPDSSAENAENFSMEKKEVDISGEKDDPKNTYGTTSDTAQIVDADSTKGKEEVGEEVVNPSLKDIILFLVLYLHGIFEGLALGLLDSVAKVLALLFGVAVHKAVILASLVIQLVKKNVKKTKSLLLIGIFSAVTPLGIIVGIVMDVTGNKETPEGELASGILGAFATGTLFYVIFMEILPEALKSQSYSFRKGLFVLLGFAVIALLTLIPDHEDDGHAVTCNVTNSTG